MDLKGIVKHLSNETLIEDFEDRQMVLVAESIGKDVSYYQERFENELQPYKDEIFKRMNQSAQKKEFKGFEVFYKPTGEKVIKANYHSFFVLRQFPDVIPLYFLSEEEADRYQQDVWTRSFRECETKPKKFFVDQEGRLWMEYYDNIEWEVGTDLVPEDYFGVRWL